MLMLAKRAKKEKGQTDLQRQRNSDSWRSTDTEKQKPRKQEEDRQETSKQTTGMLGKKEKRGDEADQQKNGRPQRLTAA